MTTATSGAVTERSVQGMGLMVFCMAVLPMMDAIAKYMATFESMSPGQVTFYRFFVQLIVLAPIFFFQVGSLRNVRRPWMNLLRGALHASASLMFFTAVKYMPLADVFAIYFVEPFMLTILSALFLGEKVGWRRWLAILVGFGGAMIVIQPSYAIFGWTSLLPVMCAALFTFYLFLNRALGDSDTPLAMQMMSGLGGTLLMGMVLLAGSTAGVGDFNISFPTSALGICLLLVLGSLSGYVHLLVVKAFRLASVSLLAPFQYFEIISATILGYLLFAEFPTPSKWLGIVIIVASGLFIIWREQVRKREDRSMS